VIAPSVAVNHPKIVVQASNPADTETAVVSEAIVNYLWRHYDFRKPFRRSVKDFLIFGHGWLKVGWRFAEQEQMLGDGELDDLYAQSVMEVDQAAFADPFIAADLPTDEEIAANLPSTAMRIVEDQPFVERVSPFDV